jgi:hypothetical protein
MDKRAFQSTRSTKPRYGVNPLPVLDHQEAKLGRVRGFFAR